MPSWIIKIEPDCPIALDVLLGFPKVLLPPNVTVWCIPEVKSTVIVEPSDNEDTAAVHFAASLKATPPERLNKPVPLSAASDLKKLAESIPSTVTASTLVTEEPFPEKAVAANVPFEELNVILDPVLGAKLPDAAVVNTGKQVLSDDSSPTVIVVAIAAVPDVFWFPPELTPGRSILADPSKLTPPIFLAVVSVAADPVVF